MELGARIRQLRGTLLTQRELAERAGVSVDLVRKLEQGQRQTAAVGSLQRIARALDVSLAELLDKPRGVPSADPDAGVVAIRRALTPVDDLTDGDGPDIEPLTLEEAERTATYLWGAYWSGRYELLSATLPNALMQLRATARAVASEQRPGAARALARAYQAAGDTLVHLGHPDAAFLAIREALRAAEGGGDPMLDSALRMSVSWQLLVQGRYEESERVAVVAANDIEPRGDASEPELAAYGILTVTGATAAARANRGAAAAELLDAAGEMAIRLGHDRDVHQTTFGPAKLAMMRVDVYVAQDEFSAALTAASALPDDAALPLASRARHLADVALAQLRLGRDAAAANTLLSMEQFAPDWIRFQTLPRQVLAELVERKRRASGPVRDLAVRLGVIAG
ncbi:helix-turn-helix domain-containing protein [Actinophytocola xanthii]|uniref:Transcriptional regulator n=1 Tax=Actinophytocola xanthii TaxID=1912961 RepID=A0A1Q8CM27_9PSEU|nr:helix-turn-helix domain-containing protein [Actinophytocola xanthii]OLF15413.1 transcriptional regulator [Actinophytocola xanthii]